MQMQVLLSDLHSGGYAGSAAVQPVVPELGSGGIKLEDLSSGSIYDCFPQEIESEIGTICCRVYEYEELFDSVGQVKFENCHCKSDESAVGAARRVYAHEEMVGSVGDVEFENLSLGPYESHYDDDPSENFVDEPSEEDCFPDFPTYCYLLLNDKHVWNLTIPGQYTNFISRKSKEWNPAVVLRRISSQQMSQIKKQLQKRPPFQKIRLNCDSPLSLLEKICHAAVRRISKQLNLKKSQPAKFRSGRTWSLRPRDKTRRVVKRRLSRRKIGQSNRVIA